MARAITTSTATFADRVNKRMSELGLTQQSLAERAGMSQAAVYKIASGKTKETKKITQLALALDVDLHWLATGENKNRQMSNAEIIGGFSEWDSGTPLMEDEVELPFFREVELSAGSGKYQVLENQGNKLRFAKATLRKAGVTVENAACVKVSGDSMEPVMPDGCTVGIDISNKHVRDGEIYAVDYDGQLLVKRLYRVIGGGLRIRSYNDAEYQDVYCTGDDVEKMNILGRVFWWAVLR